MKRAVKSFKHKIIIKAIDKLSNLTGENFHGYNSEIYNILSIVYEEAKKNKFVPSPLEPIYDDIYYDGLKWIDSL